MSDRQIHMKFGGNAAASVDAYLEYKRIVGEDDGGAMFTPIQYESYKKRILPMRMKNRVFTAWTSPTGMDCKLIGPETTCFCQHKYSQHKTDFEKIPTDRPILLPCKIKGCGCRSYHYVPKTGTQQIRCKCKHYTDDHTAVPPHKCKNGSCKCSGFTSSYSCGCGQPYDVHTMIVETKEERIARGHPVGQDVPYQAMGGLTGFSSLMEGYMRLDPSGLGAPPDEFLDQPITAADHPFLRANVQSIKHHQTKQRAIAGKAEADAVDVDLAERMSAMKKPEESDMDFYERRYQERRKAERERARGSRALPAGKLAVADLKSQVTELRRIRASVNNELRDLEGKLQGLQLEITKHKTQLESLRMQQENVDKDIQQSKLNIDQLKVEEQDFANRFQPLLKAPEQILLDDGNKNVARQPPTSPQSCRLHTCFDYSRCSVFSRFPVYVYGFENHFRDSNLNEFIKSAVFHSFDKSPYIVATPDTACVFVVVLGEIFSNFNAESIQNRLQSLSHWNGDGRNHILLNLARTSSNIDLFGFVNTGRAIVVQSSFIESIYRCNFDIITPPSLGNSDGPVWAELPPLNPIRKQYVLSFDGQFSDISNFDSTIVNKQVLPNTRSDLNSDQNFKSRNLKSAIDLTNLNNPKSFSNKLIEIELMLVEHLKKIESESKDSVKLNFMCAGSQKAGINGEWALCGSESQRADYLQKSTFNLIISPANVSVVSTTVFQIRVYEALKYAAIPVILGDYSHLPFEELLDWRKVAIILPKSRISEMFFVLSTYTDTDVMDLKRNGRMFWETYFGTTTSIISTMLAVMRTRLQIPARAVLDEPAHSSVTNFIPVAQHIGADPEDETDEVLGPIEPPFPSLTFKQNFTVSTLRTVFNLPGDPFHLYPFTPFENILPSDAKFRGSGYGFRPINHGEGGSGNEFSEAIGGNHPREQFTIVMLTYERSDVLIKAITRLNGLPYLNKVIVVWNNPAMPSENLGWPDIHVPVVVVKMPKNSLNNRFLPFAAIETEAVLSIDDDSHLRHDEIVFGFRVWREERDRIVGFPGRYHAWDVKHDSWLYNSNYTCEMSMVLTGAAFFHKYYAYLYTYTMARAIREKVDEYMNCEDIAMNFLVSHITRKPPVKVTSRWTFRCPGCPQQLALDESHFEERHKCMNFLVTVYGYMPLLYTQYRVDSILFKTRISHDKQKCFKYI